ncbi:MAG: YfcC family protein [Acetivibrio sp.]
MEKNKKRKIHMPSAYSILFLIIVAVCAITWFLPTVKNATISNMVMAAPSGFVDAIDVAIFVLVLGGFLGVIAKSGALDNGIAAMVDKLKGKEMLLIPLLMLLFSLGGTTYGMAEETIAFYALIVTTMMAAGFDAMVGVSVILLGSGVGVIGSTVNPFAISAAVDALKASNPNLYVNHTIIMILGAILWIASLVPAILFVLHYAKKVKNSGRSILSPKELAASQNAFGEEEKGDIVFTRRMKWVLAIFGFSFGVMVISLIPWENFGVTIFRNTSFLTGTNLGEWYFKELQAWFLIMAIIVGYVAGLGEGKTVEAFVGGAGDMVGVALVIAVSRGISVIMAETGLGDYILALASTGLANVSPIVFSVAAYGIYLGLSFLIPSTSGLAAASMPTFGGLTANLGLSPEVMILIFSAACGLVNLITPTSAVVMGGLSISKIEWFTWAKFIGKFLGILLILNLVILCIAMVVL